MWWQAPKDWDHRPRVVLLVGVVAGLILLTVLSKVAMASTGGTAYPGTPATGGTPAPASQTTGALPGRDPVAFTNPPASNVARDARFGVRVVGSLTAWQMGERLIVELRLDMTGRDPWNWPIHQVWVEKFTDGRWTRFAAGETQRLTPIVRTSRFRRKIALYRVSLPGDSFDAALRLFPLRAVARYEVISLVGEPVALHVDSSSQLTLRFCGCET